MHTATARWTDHLTGPLPHSEVLAATPPSVLALSGAVGVLLLVIVGVLLGVRWGRSSGYRVESADRSGSPQLAPREPYEPEQVVHGVRLRTYVRQRLGFGSRGDRFACGTSIAHSSDPAREQAPLCPRCVRSGAVFPVRTFREVVTEARFDVNWSIRIPAPPIAEAITGNAQGR